MRVLANASGPCVSSLIKSWLGSLPGDVWEAVRDELNQQITSGDMSNVHPAELVARLPVCCHLFLRADAHDLPSDALNPLRPTLFRRVSTLSSAGHVT